MIERYEDVPVYLLGPEAVISERAEERIAEATKAPVRRAAEDEDPVANAIEFARYVDGTFGWNINDPGHGLVIANASRPADAGAAAALSGTGTFGPLLLTDDADALPADLESYLLDLKPGYLDDPTRARLQPRLDRGRLGGRDDRLPGRGRRARRGRADKVRQRRVHPRPHAGDSGAGGTGPRRPGQRSERKPMSESERPDRLGQREITVDDIRALAGPATPHFALQIRNRIARLIASLPADHPAPDRGRAPDRAPDRARRAFRRAAQRGMRRSEAKPNPAVVEAAYL